MVAVVAHSILVIAVPALVVACFAATFYIYAHEPRARTPKPGHPAYEGDDDDEDAGD